MDPSNLAKRLRLIASKIDASKSPSKALVLADLNRLSTTLRKANDNGSIDSIKIKYERDYDTEGTLVTEVKGSFLGVDFDISDLNIKLFGAFELPMKSACEKIALAILSEVDFGYETDEYEEGLLTKIVEEALDKPEGREMLDVVNMAIDQQRKDWNEDPYN